MGSHIILKCRLNFFETLCNIIKSIGESAIWVPSRCHQKAEQGACQPCPPSKSGFPEAHPGPFHCKDTSMPPGASSMLPEGLLASRCPPPPASLGMGVWAAAPTFSRRQSCSWSPQRRPVGWGGGKKETSSVWCLKSPFNALRLGQQTAH